MYQLGHHGNAILSKYSFSDFDNLNLSSMHRASRSILHAQILVGTVSLVKVHLLCVHLGLFKAERVHQCAKLIALIKKNIPAHEPLIMAGDFNDWQRHLSIPLAEELGIDEAFQSFEGNHARSYPAIKPALCEDRIYFRGLTVSHVECLQGKSWRYLFDHLPLFARFDYILKHLRT